MVKLLHTADVHLGRQFASMRNRADEYRAQLIRTFEKVVDTALTEKVSVLLIAGDLFDTNRVYGLTIGRIMSAFRKLEAADIKICIIPGTHDPFTDDSLYRSLSFPRNVTILTPESTRRTFKDLDLTVYGLVWDAAGKNLMNDLPPAGDSLFHVGMAHCSLRLPGIAENDEVSLDASRIAGSGLDYLALGHWHSFQDVSQGSTRACYSGSPEPIDIDQKGAGSVVLVTLKDKGSVEAHTIRVGSKRCESLAVDVSPFESIEALAKVIEARSDPNLILEVTLSGMSGMQCDFNCREIENLLGSKFFHLRTVDRSHPRLEEVKTKNYPEKTVAGRFLRVMEEKIAATGAPEEKLLYEDAMKLGFALLQGRSQVIE